MVNVYIFTNSPGEVFSWVKPIVESLVQKLDDVSISIFLTPCQYSTGEELRVCNQFPNVVKVYSPMDTLSTVFFSTSSFLPGFVFYLGGNPMYPERFSQKTGSRLIGYAENQFNDRFFDMVLYQSSMNNLMVSNLIVKPIHERQGVCLLPGSRPEHLEVALPLMLDIVRPFSDIPMTVMLSPFTPDKSLKLLKNRYPNVSLQRMSSANDLNSFKYAITIPGTNTMQLAYFNIPFLMILPTHRSKILRLDGLLGLLLMIPLFGSALKFIILRFLERLNRLYALPNKMLGDMICPELVGRFSVEDAQSELKSLIFDEFRYSEISQSLKEIRQSSDVANYFSDWVYKQVN